MAYLVIVERDQHGFYAYCPELPGCQTQGETFEEVMKNIREAIELYLETLTEEELTELKAKEIITALVEV
ncbi:type II toxin-antitoxin system HicB family antitoxin [Pampinifervens florentissimum]|uniref:type II toxin-antitoxin system HicB family antitoxin n=1 Tax=Pampinifervens florentissimum TaxID=1632019 RepID=UPI0013B49A60|nr:type II toxin-antitoxin system HicB family antitoxin [Hydrogenobacter sp. T-8]QID32767.1 type II toxin-antitoxin system HicB family antitoxin [Hydrogenobacter sp. T-8]